MDILKQQGKLVSLDTVRQSKLMNTAGSSLPVIEKASKDIHDALQPVIDLANKIDLTSLWAPDNALNFVEAKDEYKKSVPIFLKEVPWLERFKNAARKVPLLKLGKAKNIRKRILNMPSIQDLRLKNKVEIALKKIKAQLILGKESAY